MTSRDDSAADLRHTADALDRAARHCRTAADHLDADDVPRMAAHALAARGDLLAGSTGLDEVALRHARHAST